MPTGAMGFAGRTAFAGLIGLMALTGGEKPHQIVATLLAQIQSRGLQVRGVVLDSGFDSGETLLLLQERALEIGPLKLCVKELRIYKEASLQHERHRAFPLAAVCRIRRQVRWGSKSG